MLRVLPLRATRAVPALRNLVTVIRRLLYVGIMKHQRCIEQWVGQPVNVRVTVPSLNRHPGVHPFAAIAAAIRAVDDRRLALMPAPHAVIDRIVSAGQFQIVRRRSLAGQHVLILDDTWTTGANTQSAALTLRQAGAAKVSVMVIGRWLSQTYGHNAEFITTRLRRDYDPGICPVTGGACPGSLRPACVGRVLAAQVMLI